MHVASPVGVAKRRVGVGEQQVPDGRRLRRLQVGVVGGQCRLRLARTSGECRDLVEKCVVELTNTRARGQAEPDAKGLAPRPARAQPAGGGAADAPLELRLAGVEGVAKRGIPRELLTRDRVQLEQSSQKRASVVTREVTALDQRNRVREVSQRQATRESRPVRALRGVRRGHQLTRCAAAQPPTTPQLLHPPEPRGAPARRLPEYDE